MTFSKSSFFAGVGSVFAAIVLGFAGGAMMTGGAGVQSPNRVERVAAGEALQKSSGQPVAVATTPAPAPTMAAATAVPASDPQPVARQSAPAAPAAASNETMSAPKIQQPTPAPAIVAKGDDAPPRNDQVNDRAIELKKAAERKRAEERKFAERRKRQDIEQAANAVRQMRRDGVIDQVVQRDEAPRFGFFGNDDN
jgi:hypothetical protein